MREIDRRAQVGRRTFLKGSATAVPAAALAAAGSAVDSRSAWAQNAKTLSPHAMATLVLMARDIYPHDHIADICYIVAASGWDGKAASDPAVKANVEQGVAALDANAHDRFGSDYIDVANETDRVVLLQGIESSGFFKAVRADLVVSFYNQKAVWTKLGYEGASAEKGGYIHRGFNDIDWVAKS